MNYIIQFFKYLYQILFSNKTKPSLQNRNTEIPKHRNTDPQPSPDTTFIATADTITITAPKIKPLSDILIKSLKHPFNELQLHSIKAIAAAMDTHGITDLRQQAYILATVWHECKFKPIKERRARRGTSLRRTQDRYWHTGYYGRGFVQLTWRENYERLSTILGIDLVNDPEACLDPLIAADILVVGMRDGLFSGRRLSQYFGRSTRWQSARAVVNGTDKAPTIARTAKKIYTELIIYRH